jgi:AraC family transcriptional regulator
MPLSDEQKLTLRALPSESGKLTGVTPFPPRRIGAPVLRLRVGLPPRVLRRVDEYIDVHLGKTISLNTLADVAGLSPSHFSRMFRQSKGVSPGDYLSRRRVERTMELLAGTDLSLAEIALAIGFSDQSHCSRSFRKHVGICPREYRRSRPSSRGFPDPSAWAEPG